MPIVRSTFFGLTVRDINSRAGWNQQGSELSVQLVADAANGDSPAPVAVGAPCSFTVGGFTFAGLLRRWAESRGTDGFPVYEAQIVDPREILDGATVITGDYNGAVTVPNLLNAFGWWEDQAFGASGSNPSGMPWANVLTALTTMSNTVGGTSFGGPLNHKGFTYGLDLSHLPVPPASYRVPAGHASIMDMVSQICEDGGCDYFVQLDGTTIIVRTVSRGTQPPLGTLTTLLATSAYSGHTVRSEAGTESRNETTSAFLVGGAKTTVNVTDAIASYWGTDVNGFPVIGVAGVHPDLGACEYMTVKADEVADILGARTYTTNTFELRFALHNDDSWRAYIKKYFAATTGTLIFADWVKNIPVECKPDAVNDDPVQIAAMLGLTLQNRAARLYDFVRRLATDFYGKEFLVRIPFVLASTDSETGKVTLSSEPTEAGWFEGGAEALGISAINQDVIQQPDERVLPFVYYPTIVGAEMSRTSWADSAVDPNGSLWCRAILNPRVVFIPGVLPVPCAHMRLTAVLYDEPTDDHGNMAIINPIIANGAAVLPAQNVAKRAFGGTIGGISVHPAARYPTAAGVPLKSTILTYGPWYAEGAPGKVRYEQDPSLTPWDYGGSDVMDTAGADRVVTALTNTQAVEAGSVTLAGAPNCSLGDLLVADGPHVTGVDVRYGTTGVTTTYRMETFTPRFYGMGRQNHERMRRQALLAVQFRRDVRRALARAFAAAQATDAAFRGFKANRALMKRKESPLDVLMVESFTSDNGDTRVVGGVDKYEAAILFQTASGGLFQNKGMMSMAGLLRPYTTNATGTGLLPRVTTPSGVTGGTNTPTVATGLNPFASGNDIEVLAWGTGYTGAHAYRRGADANNTRPLALRGPLVIAGFGDGIDGRKYPGTGTTYPTGYLRHSENWKVGPVDHLWDNRRGVWTSHDVVTARVPTTLALAASGTVDAWVGGDSSWTIPVYNPFSRAVGSGVTIVASYAFNLNKFVVIAADCS